MMHEREDRPTEPASTLGKMSCEEFQAQMPELIGSEDIHKHEHLKTCDRCSALLSDLEYIAESVRGMLPIHEPSSNLWKKIEASMHGPGPEDSGPRSAAPRG